MNEIPQDINNYMKRQVKDIFGVLAVVFFSGLLTFGLGLRIRDFVFLIVAVLAILGVVKVYDIISTMSGYRTWYDKTSDGKCSLCLPFNLFIAAEKPVCHRKYEKEKV